MNQHTTFLVLLALAGFQMGFMLIAAALLYRLLTYMTKERHFREDMVTPVSTIRGLVVALEAGISVNGGLTLNQRHRIYQAMDVEFDRFMRGVPLPTLQESVSESVSEAEAIGVPDGDQE